MSLICMAYCHSNDAPFLSPETQRPQQSGRHRDHFHAIQPHLLQSAIADDFVNVSNMQRWDGTLAKRTAHSLILMSTLFNAEKTYNNNVGLSLPPTRTNSRTLARVAFTLKCAFAVEHKMLWALISYVTLRAWNCAHPVRMPPCCCAHNTHHK